MTREELKVPSAVIVLLTLLDPPPLEVMGYRRHKKVYRVHRKRFRLYWKDIDGFKGVETEVEKHPYRVRQVLKLLGKSSLEELSEQDIPRIESLTRIDCKLAGVDIPPSTLRGVKKRLIRKILEKHQ